MSRTSSHRISRAFRHSRAQGVFLHYASAYRTAAREQGVERLGRFGWLRNVPRAAGVTTGAGLLAHTRCTAPVDAHDAALRVLAEWAPGVVRMDALALRAEMVRLCRAQGKQPPYFRLRHV